ncbi:MAG: SIS domain-containing protein [Pseudomonadota bacterium]
MRETAERLQKLDPHGVITVGRGSSDHAATYLSYAIQLTLGLPVASIGPSMASVYGQSLRARGFATLAISQSGASQDIVQLAGSLGSQGARVIALTNSADSPLTRVADHVVDVRAGRELAVAATKSFLNSIVSGLWIIAMWARDKTLARALQDLPDAIRAAALDPAHDQIQEALIHADRAMVIARGPTLGIAQEFSLKLIETCRIHATPYSAAEVLHGPSALLTDGFPVVALGGGVGAGLDQAIEKMKEQAARLIVVPANTNTGHALVDPLVGLQPLYRVTEALSRSRNLDPDRPAYLKKETKTI